MHRLAYWFVASYDGPAMSAKKAQNPTPQINNRRAFHDYFIDSKLECGMALMGSEVKSLREGKAQLAQAFVRVERGELILHGCHIDPYEKAGKYSHEPLRERKLLAHKREIRKLEAATAQRGTTIVPLMIYFKEGRVKIEIGLAHGKQQHDKRDAIRKKEQDRALRRGAMYRG